MSFANKILSFLKSVELKVDLPVDIEVMNPFKDKATIQLCTAFYKKYYSEDLKRRMIIGINPGRFGGGITGIPFTDPIRLQNECGIQNQWQHRQELSSVFVYDVISAFGGAQKFYNKFYINSVSPLGFTKHNKNLNYYDDKFLQNAIKDFVIECMKTQLKFGIDTSVAYCFGDGKNFKYLSKLNEEQQFFSTIIPLSHPRFIMQYKLKKKAAYIHTYLEKFNLK